MELEKVLASEKGGGLEKSSLIKALSGWCYRESVSTMN